MGGEPELNVPFIRGSGSWAYLWTMRVLLVLMALTGFAGLPLDAPAQAQSAREAALEVAQAPEVKPLTEVLKTVKARVPGQVVDVQLDKSGNPWTYQIRIRSEKGNVVLVVVDAYSGKILSTQGNR